jgi:hypothetical protein
MLFSFFKRARYVYPAKLCELSDLEHLYHLLFSHYNIIAHYKVKGFLQVFPTLFFERKFIDRHALDFFFALAYNMGGRPPVPRGIGKKPQKRRAL